MVDFSGLVLNKREPVYEQIAAHAKRQILLGLAQNGDIMPSRRELAAMTGVNPNTAQKAYRRMEDEGFVVTSGNTASTLLITEALRAQIEDELCNGLVQRFVQEAKQNHLSYKKLLDLVSEVWDAE